MQARQISNDYSKLQEDNKTLSKTVHDYGNLIQRLYMMVLVKDGNDSQVVKDVETQVSDFITRLNANCSKKKSK